MRLHTIDAFLFWCMGSLMRLVGFVCPLLYWWFGIGVMRTNADDLLIQMGPYWLCSVVYLGWVSRGAIIPVFTEALTLLVVREALRATLVGLFGKRDQTFKVTAKGARRDQMVVQWDLLRVFLLMLLLTAGGIAWRTWQGPVDAASSASEAISLFWSIYNMFTVTVAALICVELPRRRLEERFATDETTFVTWDHGMALMRIRNISVIGCGLEPVAGPAPPAGSEIALTVPQVGAVSARIVSSSGTLTACAFALTPALHDALLMKLFSGRYLFSPSSMNPIQFFRTALSRVFAS
jgi:cellulose synthase (UDP-forming)